MRRAFGAIQGGICPNPLIQEGKPAPLRRAIPPTPPTLFPGQRGVDEKPVISRAIHFGRHRGFSFKTGAGIWMGNVLLKFELYVIFMYILCILHGNCLHLEDQIMHLNLGSEFDDFIKGQVDSGLYGNATEVIRDALRHMKDGREQKRLETIRALLAVGEEQIARGETVRYTPDLLSRLTKEAIQNSKKGKPIKDEVKPRP